MQTASISSIKSIPPALIGAALDCLAQLPDGHRLCPTLLRSVAHVIGCDRADTPALLARIRAAAIVMNDPRWPPWSAHFQYVRGRTAAGLRDRLARDHRGVAVAAGSDLPRRRLLRCTACQRHAAQPRGMSRLKKAAQTSPRKRPGSISAPSTRAPVWMKARDGRLRENAPKPRTIHPSKESSNARHIS